MSPLPKVPVQGDAKRLASLASGVKMQNGTSGPLVQRTDVGRPPGANGTAAPAPTQPTNYQVPQEHQDLMQVAAQAEVNRQFWADWAKRYPGPNADFYAQQADLEAQQAHEALYKATPNFHGE